MAALGASAAILALGWWFLAPGQIGGRTSYVTTTGTSMEPLLHAGDLVIVRSTGDYEVGDVVAYRNAQLGQVVLHRIVDIEGARYVFQGDHNDWVDDYEPTADEVIGEMSVRMPGMGSRLEVVRSPIGMAAVAGATTFGVLGRRRRSRRERARERKGARDSGGGHTPAKAPRGKRSSGAALAVSGAVLVVIGVTALAVGFLAPPTTTVTTSTAFDELGTFAYAADGGPGSTAVYGRSTIVTGDPVYRELADEIRFRFRYELRTHGSAIDGTGTAAMIAVLADGNGWTRTLTLTPATSFSGRKIALDGTLDLREVARLTASVERVSGVPNASYTLSIEPQVLFDGDIAGHTVHRAFAPSLALIVDPMLVRVAPPDTTGDGPPADPYHVERTDAVHAQREIPRRFGWGDVSLGTAELRTAGAVVLGVGIVFLFLVAFARARTARAGEAALIRARYGRWLVPVSGRTLSGGTVVDVESFDALRKLAEHYGQVVLDQHDDRHDVFSVDEDGVTYRYRVSAEDPR
jgi:signal peptidase I